MKLANIDLVAIANSALAVALGVFVGELITARGRIIPSLITAVICAALAVVLLLATERGISAYGRMLVAVVLACCFSILGWLMGWIGLFMFEFKIVPHNDTDTHVSVLVALFWLFRS